MGQYGVREKKIVFNDTDKRHADLKIRLQHDELTQSEFFRSMVTGYIKSDPRIISFLYEWLEKNKNYPKSRKVKSQKSLKKGEELKEVFGLSEGEIDKIFDIMEEEHPDL